MVVENIADEVDDRGGDQDEEDEHGNHEEVRSSDGVEQEADRYLHQSNQFGSSEAWLLVKGKVLVGSKDVDADG